VRLLDLFCGAGGAAMGYHRAGFDVVGVDNRPQPNYPFRFWQADALRFLDCDWPKDGPRHFDAIHASPPCQAHSNLKAVTRHIDHPDLVEPTRKLLKATGLPYVIENVEGAPLHSPIMLCGSMFDPALDVRRHRLFEANWPLEAHHWPCRHDLLMPRFDVYEHGKWRKSSTVPVYGSGGGKSKDHWADAMGIDWMTHDEMAQAIPPAYTEFIGEQLVAHLAQLEEVA
jgi:DNA (cytosine-5)-methyltransferase 1